MRTFLAFFKGLFLNPRSMGALFPSSDQLANKMAAYIDISAQGYVLELGAGTGVITKGILKAGVPADKLICLELAPHFASGLRKQFPNITIIEGNAAHLSEFVKQSNQQVILITFKSVIRVVNYHIGGNSQS